ncbi:hypothetical protein GCM10008018_71490 [Paenibacillus marchantiophytorum]|uniref:Uncharacterized protein n=1 Tax=Paenibacillus marchantiophytorum TaxID=1619310 RepID=A0ABQ1FJH7_9BACL|nr:hypothetical protein [Paenibacillus marchantiophytorum]GGA16752.1 hypothetical protein GCM10008018_71490 [Paenibacillus marchantiophytorum]
MQEIKDRKFQFWFYRVSHGELLIRSPKSKENPKNIDIMFFDIRYIELPRFLDEIMLDEATNEEILYLNNKLGEPLKDRKVTIIVSRGIRYLIVASFFKVKENELDLFELPFEKLGLSIGVIEVDTDFR